MKVAIIGRGWVGEAMKKLFPDAYVYSPSKGTREKVNEADVAFICVPTPNGRKKELDTSIVEEVVDWCECPLLVIRSTVNPGDTDRLIRKFDKRIVVQPEYLGETPNHPMLDPKRRGFLIIGGEPEARRELIELYTDVYNANIDIRQVSAYEAEIIKMTENRAISFKVAQCQELYDVCEVAGVDYYTIRQAVYGDDPRFNLWWTFIYPEKRGFNSKCIPKDIYGWCAWAESVGYEPKLTKKLLEINEEYIK
jgi:UDP-glucose 6-dehydrogenase